MNEEEIIGANPLCFHCLYEIELEKASILLMRGYFIVMHPACHAKNIEEYRISKGVNAEIKEVVN